MTFETIYYINMIALIGACLGSFITCWAYRYNREISIVKVKDSFCDSCGKKLNFIELLPIFGTILTGGKCRKCGVRYSKVSFLVEIFYAIFTPCIYYLDLHISLRILIYVTCLSATFVTLVSHDMVRQELRLDKEGK